jgi:hypothetical protein
VALIAPILWRNQAQRASREVIIGRKGLVLNGAFHTWIAPLNKLTEVQFHSEPSGQTLEFTIRTLNKASLIWYQENPVIVPVPKGHEEMARSVVAVLSKKS